MKKKVLVLIAMVGLICGCGKVPVLENGQEAVVSFKEEGSISVDDFYTKLKEKYGISSLIDMIDDYIFGKEYPDSNTDKETYAKEYLANFKKNYETNDEYLNALNQSGFETEDDAKVYLELNYLRNLAVEDYAKSLVKEKEIKSYYEKNTVGDIRCSHILITWEANDDVKEEDAKATALKKANDLIKKLEKANDVSKTFAELAKEYSEDTASAKNGGDLDFFNKGVNVKEFETAAYALKKGEYTKAPVESQFGFHIILKTDEKEKASYDDAKEEIKSTLATEKISADKEIQINALTKLRDKYDMKIQDSSLVKNYNSYIQELLAYLKSSNQ